MNPVTNTGVTFLPTCNSARPYLLLFSMYAVCAGMLLVVHPTLILDFPLLGPIERLTGLPHLPTPTTIEGRQLLSMSGLFAAAIGMYYGIEAGPYWEHGGRAFAQISIDGRLIFAATSLAVSFLTPYGSSILAGVAFLDAVVALLTQMLVGGRKELIGRPQSSFELKKL